MRPVMLFLVAFGLASLAVQGQEKKEQDLLDRIEALTRELEARLEKREQDERGARIEVRTYEVGDLIAKIADGRLEPANLLPSNWQPPEPQELAEPCAPFEIDMLIEIIRQLVEPETWDTLQGADIQPRPERLIVFTIPRVHEQIARLLRGLRERESEQVAVDLVAVPVTTDTLASLGAHPRELPPEIAARLLEERPLGAVRLVGHDSQQLAQRAGKLRSYLADYDVKIAEKAAIAHPIRAEVFEGCGVQVRAILDRQAQGAMLHLRVERTHIHEAMRRADTVHGPLDLPAMDLTRLHTSAWVPLDKTVVLGGGAKNGEGCLFLATARRLKP